MDIHAILIMAITPQPQNSLKGYLNENPYTGEYARRDIIKYLWTLASSFPVTLKRAVINYILCSIKRSVYWKHQNMLANKINGFFLGSLFAMANPS